MAASRRSVTALAGRRLPSAAAAASAPHWVGPAVHRNDRRHYSLHRHHPHTSPATDDRAVFFFPRSRHWSSFSSPSLRPTPASSPSSPSASPLSSSTLELPSSLPPAPWSLTPRPVSPSSLGSRASPSAFSQRNICLMGSPGSGKSSVGRELSKLLGLPLLGRGRRPAGGAVGDERGGQVEGGGRGGLRGGGGPPAQPAARAEPRHLPVGVSAALLHHLPPPMAAPLTSAAVLSSVVLCRSNPLNREAMGHIVRNAVLVYLDCPAVRPANPLPLPPAHFPALARPLTLRLPSVSSVVCRSSF